MYLVHIKNLPLDKNNKNSGSKRNCITHVQPHHIHFLANAKMHFAIIIIIVMIVFETCTPPPPSPPHMHNVNFYLVGLPITSHTDWLTVTSFLPFLLFFPFLFPIVLPVAVVVVVMWRKYIKDGKNVWMSVYELVCVPTFLGILFLSGFSTFARAPCQAISQPSHQNRVEWMEKKKTFFTFNSASRSFGGREKNIKRAVS